MSKPFDRLLLNEMIKEDEDELMFDGETDEDILDALMDEDASVNEAMSELFPPEEKFAMEVS